MSQHRGRNIFTLGNFHLKGQRSLSETRKRLNTNDIFERDPFKIQSYNFRYAERPTYPVRPVQRQQEQPQKQFNTFYHNQDFSPVAVNNAGGSRYGGIGNREYAQGSPSSYREYRRRKFLQNGGIPYPTTLNSSTNLQFHNNRQTISNSSHLTNSFADKILETKKPECQRNLLTRNSSELNGSSLLKRSITNSFLENSNRNRNTESSVGELYNGFTASNQKMQHVGNASQSSSFYSMRPNISQKIIQPSRNFHQNDHSFTFSSTNFSTSHRSDTRTHQALASSARSSCMKRKRSSSSGCEININIKNLEDNSISDNVTIKIERDPVQDNLDETPRKKQNFSCNTPNIKFNTNNAGSSTSFVIDKRLSKFAMDKKETESSLSNTNGISKISLKNNNFSRSTMNSREKTLNNPLEKNFKERTKTLSSIYATLSQNLAQKKSSTSTERMPSLVPWRDNINVTRKLTTENLKSSKIYRNQKSQDTLSKTSTNLRRPTSTSSRILSTSPQSFMTYQTTTNKVNNVMKSTDSKNSLKRIILQKFHSSKNSGLCSQPKRLNGGALPTHSERRCLVKDSQKLYCSKTKRINWSKLPLKININVFAEKVKLLRA